MKRFAFVVALLLSCGRPLDLPSAPAAEAVHVASVSPSRVFEGQRVEIAGSGLGSDVASIRVLFGPQAAARPAQASEDGSRLVVVVPAGAQSGEITVENANGSGRGGTVTIAGPGFPTEGRVGRAGDLGRETMELFPMPDGDGLAALLFQRVPGEGQGAFGRVRADGSFTSLFDGRVEAAWVSPDPAKPIAYVLTFELADSGLAKAIVLHRRMLDGSAPDRELRLSPHDFRSEYETPTVTARPDGRYVAVNGATGTWFVEDDGTSLVERDFHEPRGEPNLPPDVEYLGNDVFVAVQRSSLLVFNTAVEKPVRDAVVWKPSGFGVADAPVFASTALDSGGFLLAVASTSKSGVTLYRASASPVSAADFGLPYATIPTPLISGVDHLAFTVGGGRLAVASDRDVTLYDTGCFVSAADQGDPATGCVPTPLASAQVPEVEAMTAVPGILFAARVGGVTAFSAETGAFVGSMDVGSGFTSPDAVTRRCDGTTDREVFEVLSTTFRSLLSIDPATLSPVRCGTTVLPGNGRVFAQAPIPGSSDRLVLSARAAGGAELWRQTPGNHLVTVGAPLAIPRFVPGCDFTSESLVDVQSACGIDQQLRVSPDGKYALVSWFEEDHDSSTNVASRLVAVKLDAPFAGTEPPVVEAPADATFIAARADAIVVSGLSADGSATTQVGRLSIEGAVAGRMEPVGSVTSLAHLPGAGAAIGDALSPGLFAFLLPGQPHVNGPDDPGAVVVVDPASGISRSWERADRFGGRAWSSPDGGLVAWLELVRGTTHALVWHGFRFAPDGGFQGALPAIDLPVEVPLFSFPFGTAPGVAFSADGSRALVTVPNGDVVVRVD